ADAELADELRVLLLIAREPREKLSRARFCDGAEVLYGFGAVHAYAVIGDGDRAGLRVEVDGDGQLAVAGEQLRPGERFETQFVAGVGSVGDELAKKDFLMAVQRMDHQLEQLFDLRLKPHGLRRNRLAHRPAPSDANRPGSATDG